jgi:MFS family permease
VRREHQAAELYTPTFFLGFAYNFVIALNFTNNAVYPLFIRHEGGGVALVGIFMGLFALAGVAGRPLVGFLLDRYGARNILMLGSLLLSLPAAGYYFLLGTGLGPLVWILRAVQGFGYGAHFSATFTLAGHIAPIARRNEAIAMYGMSGLLGSTVGPFLGEMLAEGPGLPAFFLLMVGSGILAALIISFVRLERQGNDVASGMRSLLAPLRVKKLRNVLLLAFCLAIAFSSPTSFLAALAKHRQIEHFSLYFTAWGISGALIRFIGGRWGDRIGFRRVLIPGFILYMCGLLTIHFSGSLAGFIAAGVLCGSAHGISFPAVTSLGYSLAPSDSHGSTMALVTGMMDAGTAFTALAMGPIAEIAGFRVVFPFAAAMAGVALAAVLIDLAKRQEAMG